MKKTVLVTGCNGFIGSAFVRFIKEKYHIIGIDKTPGAFPKTGNGLFYQGDICDTELLQRVFAEHTIDAVLHTAAEKSLLQCQNDPERAYRTNYLATEYLYALARRAGAQMVFLSSDQVFPGTTANSAEDAPVQAINYYGELKIKAEKLLRANPNAAICRTALVFGRIPEEQLAYFDSIKAQRELAVQGYIIQQTRYCLAHRKEIVLPRDEFVSPTDVELLARQLDAVLEKQACGILHCCGKGRISRYEMGQLIAQHYGLDPGTICPEGPENKLRPKDVSLNCTRTERLLGFDFPTFEESLREY